MGIKPNYRLRSAALAIAIALAAGSASTVLADAKGGPAVVVHRTAASSTVGVAGLPIFRTTTASVTRERVVPISSSRSIAVTWDETDATGRTEHWYALAADGRHFNIVTPTSYNVGLQYATFDPMNGEPAIPASLRAGAGNELYLVQFVIPPVEEFRRDVTRLGGHVERFLTDHTNVVRMDAAAAAQVAALPYVRWVGAYHPAYRLSADIRTELAAGQMDLGMERYSIETMRVGMAQQQAIADEIRRQGGIIEVVTPDGYRLEATMSRQTLLSVAARNEVNYIDPWYGPGGTDMMVIRQLEGAIPTLTNINVTGQGVRAEVHDTEVRQTHQAFQTPPVLLHRPDAGNPGEAHGSAVFGIMFANWASNPTYNGLLTNCEQGIYIHYTLSTQFGGSVSRLTLNTEATDPAGPYRSCLQTSSVGSPLTTQYTTLSAETDDYLFRVDYLSCQSQSNAGSQQSRPQAWAKNIVSVGGIDWHGTLSRTDDSVSGASTGPAADGRIKPDLANCYDEIPSTWNSSNTGTTVFGGTSGATPITAGCFGLLTQLWHEGTWAGFGGGSSVFTDRPKSTTAKALMVATAYRYPLTQGSLTRARQGFGMPDLTNLYNLRNKTFIVNATDLLTNGAIATYHVNVAGGEPTLSVSLDYIDPMGNPSAGQARINDLSLRVTSPSGAMYWGNNGLSTSNFSTPGGSEDHVDTLENVFVQNPEAGSWTVEVLGTSIVQDGHLGTPAVDADFSLVAAGATGGPPPPLTIVFPAGAPALIAPNTPTNLDFQVIPGSQNVSGTPMLLYRFDSSSSYISLPAASQGGNDYRATLPGAPCGSTAEFYFSAMGDQGATATLPLNAPTTVFSSPVGEIVTNTVLNVDFNGVLPAGWTANGLWHVSGSCAPTGTPCAGPQWAYYGQETGCSYNTGVANSGTLTAPPIVIPPVPPGGSLTLTYCSALQTENTANYDKAQALINGTEVDRAADSAGWTTRTVNLAPFAGQTVTLAFKFDSVDGVNNGFRGWQIDNLVISGQTTGCTNVCYANCDGSTASPVLNVNDFVCFQNHFAAGDSYANCDGSTGVPVLNVNDFVCFQNSFAAGCP